LVGAENIESGEIVVMDQYYHSLRDRLEVAAGYVIEDDVAMTDAGAVLARMYDIPAITTCSGVCRDITTGDRVAVQGGTGILIHELRSSTGTQRKI
jgi:phosphohistidine swiveling domain-containing protein